MEKPKRSLLRSAPSQISFALVHFWGSIKYGLHMFRIHTFTPIHNEEKSRNGKILNFDKFYVCRDIHTSTVITIMSH